MSTHAPVSSDPRVRRRQLDAEREQIHFLLAHAVTPYDAASLRNRYTVISALIEQMEALAEDKATEAFSH